jgi:hypothetical protein
LKKLKLSNILEAKIKKPRPPRPLKVFVANHFAHPPDETKLRFGKRTYGATPKKGQYYSADIMIPTEILQEIDAIVKKNPTLVFTTTKAGGIEFIWYDSDAAIAPLLSAQTKQQLTQLVHQAIQDNFPPGVKPRRGRDEMITHVVGDILQSRKAQLRNLVRPFFNKQVDRGKAYAQLKRLVRDAGDSDSNVTLQQIQKALKVLQ